eukprot:g3649.t1
MQDIRSEVVLPGDVVVEQLPTKAKLRLGPGLQIEGNGIHTTHVGVLKQMQNRKLWVRTRHRKYVPSSGDSVLGIIQDRNSEFFTVDINAPWMAELPVTSFENVTRRNIPPLKPGDVIFGTVLQAILHSNPILSCTNSQGKSSGMGVLKGGQITKISCSLARSLLSHPMHPALEILGNQVQFEIVIGLNGMMWIDSKTPSTTIHLSKTLSQCEDLTIESINKLCRNVFVHLK